MQNLPTLDEIRWLARAWASNPSIRDGAACAEATLQTLRTWEALRTGAPPTTPPPDGGDDVDGLVLDVPGLVHQPEPGNERKRFDLPIPSGRAYQRVEVELVLGVGQWSETAEDNHNVFWLQRSERWRGNVFGYLNVFGPPRNAVRVVTTVGHDAGDRDGVERRAKLAFGASYHVRYVFDAAQGRTETVLAEIGGDEVVRIVGEAPVDEIRSEAPGFFLALGHGAQEAGREVPTYGWTYSDVRVRFVE